MKELTKKPYKIVHDTIFCVTIMVLPSPSKITFKGYLQKYIIELVNYYIITKL